MKNFLLVSETALRTFKHTIGILALTLLLAGCLTEDYNLRAIKEDRNLSSADSTAHRVSFGDTVWTAKHGKQWASAGVIITNVDNLLQGNHQWLTAAVAEGFKGAIVIEWDASSYNVSWSSDPVGTWNKDLQIALGSITTNTWSVNTTGGASVFDSISQPGDFLFYINPATSDIWGPAVGNIMRSQSVSLLANINGNATDHSIYYKINYKNSYWLPNETNRANMITLDADPLTKGYNIGSYSVGDLSEFDTAWDNAVYDLRSYADLVVSGDRLDTTIDKLTDRSIKGVFFDSITSANYVADVLTKSIAYRSAYSPINEQDSILLIAGVLNDVYHETSSTVYSEMINSFIQAGIYFTPGANASYFDYPDYQPGDWWIRSDDDSNWQDNDNNPTYADYSNHPRKLYGVAVMPTVSSEAAIFPLGGHTWSSAIGHDEQYWVLGGDVSAWYTSSDYGQSWVSHNQGIANIYDQPTYYGRDVISVKNSYFEGFVGAVDNGVFELAIPFADTDAWEPMIPQNLDNYIGYTYYTWAPNGWQERVPFASLDWDGNDLLVATSGRIRRNNTTFFTYYPWNVADGDSLTGDLTENDDWYLNTFGKVGLWKYDYAKGASLWHPVETGADSYNQAWGAYKDVDVSIVAGDTVYVVATSAGPKRLTVNGASQTWENLDQYNWANGSETNIDPPNFTYDVDDNTDYNYAGPDGPSSIGDGHITVVQEINTRLPSSGTITLAGDVYSYSSYNGNTFNLSSTLTSEYDKGDRVRHTTDTQATWSVFATDRGDVYCVVDNEDQNWNGNSGLYKLDYGEVDWYWVGDGTGIIPTENFAPLAGNPLVSVEDSGNGDWANNTLQPDYPSVLWQVTDAYVRVSGNEGSGADADTLYMGGQGSYTTVRTRVPYGVPSNLATWELIIWRDYTTDNPRLTQVDFPIFEGIPNGWAAALIHKVAVDPEDANRIFVTPGDYGAYSLNGGTTWLNNNFTDDGDPEWYKGTGYDQTCINGLAVLGDGRLVVSRGDVYASITKDNTWEYINELRPGDSDSYDTCTTGAANNFLISSETGGVMSFQGWNGENPTDDYIVFANGDIIQGNQPSKLFLIHDDNGDGDFYDWDEWKAITADLTNNDQYLLKYNQVTDGNTKIWSSYTYYTNTLCSGTPSVDHYGVMEYEWDGANWSYTSIDAPTIATFNVSPTRLLYQQTQNRLWAIAKYSPGGGGVYVIDLDDVTPTWVGVMGTGTEAADFTPWYSSSYGDFQSIAMNDAEDLIYVGSRGGSGKQSGIFRISNADEADITDITIEHIMNNTRSDEYAYPNSLIIPEITDAEWTIAEAFYTSRGWTTKNLTAQRLCVVSDIIIDPYDDTRIWFTMAGNLNRLTTFSGLYAFDVANNEIAHVFPDDPRSWLTSTRAGLSLIYTETTDPPRFVWGTHCLGVSYFEYNGLFPTGDYGEGEVPIEMMGMSMDASIFSDDLEDVVDLPDPEPTVVDGAPIINEVLGTVSISSIITINGSNFGSNIGTIELRNNNFYDEATIIEQMNTLSWTPTGIPVMVSLNNFADGETVYLFVKSADGKVSLPYEITIGM